MFQFMKKSKKQEPKKEEQLKNWTYDRNSQEVREFFSFFGH